MQMIGKSFKMTSNMCINFDAPLKIHLPETNIFSENGWLEYDRFLLVSTTIFRGRPVSFREGYI